MKYKATQVYLAPEEHARLKAEAARRGISLAALLRELASTGVGERAPEYAAKSWDNILVDADADTDIARDLERYAEEAADALYKKKIRRAKPSRRPAK